MWYDQIRSVEKFTPSYLKWSLVESMWISNIEQGIWKGWMMFSREDHVTAFQNVQNKVIVCYPTAYWCNVTLQQSVVSRISVQNKRDMNFTCLPITWNGSGKQQLWVGNPIVVFLHGLRMRLMVHPNGAVLANVAKPPNENLIASLMMKVLWTCMSKTRGVLSPAIHW